MFEKELNWRKNQIMPLAYEVRLKRACSVSFFALGAFVAACQLQKADSLVTAGDIFSATFTWTAPTSCQRQQLS